MVLCILLVFQTPFCHSPLEFIPCQNTGLVAVSACSGSLGDQSWAGFELSRAMVGAHLPLVHLAFPPLLPALEAEWFEES